MQVLGPSFYKVKLLRLAEQVGKRRGMKMQANLKRQTAEIILRYSGCK